MNQQRHLYQKVILNHNRNPIGWQACTNPTHQCVGDNPLCGDQYEVKLRLEDNVLTEIGFEGEGCAISKASASMMNELVLGKTIDEVRTIMEDFFNIFKFDQTLKKDMGDLEVFRALESTSSRIKCATLIWKALEGALEGDSCISTES